MANNGISGANSKTRKRSDLNGQQSETNGAEGLRLDAALNYTSKGWTPVPIPLKEKNPGFKGWQKYQAHHGRTEEDFRGVGNIGLLLGSPSKGLVDIDLDWPEAARLAPKFLPATDMKSGRDGAPCSHWWYVCRDAKTEQWKDSNKPDDKDRVTIVELRSTGAQTIVEPSIHPSGETYKWQGSLNPTEVDHSTLRKAVSRLAACALIARYWPNGSRHDAALALAGASLRNGWTVDEANNFILSAAAAANDDELEDRAKAVLSTDEKIRARESVTGIPKLVDIFGKKTIDKFVAWLELRAGAREQAPAQPDEQSGDTPGYHLSNTGIIYNKWVKERGGGLALVKIPVTNFVAEITGDVHMDDGAEQATIFAIRARIPGGPWREISVPSAEYDSLKWRHTALGARAIVYPGMSEHAKVAIALLSNNITSKRVRAHTGWHHDGDRWLYYHAAGAIGADGIVDAAVELHEKLQPAILVEPPVGNRLRDAVHAVFTDLIAAAEESIMFPALGGVWAAPLTGVDFSEFFAGTTGYGKSETAALVQSFWGAGFNSRNFTADWDWTETALIALAHQAKDMLIVVDEASPKESFIEQVKLRTKIGNVMRAQGNLSGRGRGNTDGTLRKAVRSPRGIILGTGEDKLRGESLQARVATLHFGQGSVDWAKMTICQQQARDGLYVQIMSAYIQWLAVENRIGSYVKEATLKMEEYRGGWFQEDRHKRVSSMLGQIERAWDVFFDFAKDCGALADKEVVKLKQAVKAALTALAESLENSRTIENPANRFIELIWSSLGSGRAHLTTFTGGTPVNHSAMGWRVDERIDSEGKTYADYKPLGVRIGWIEETDVYLQKDAAYKMANDLAGNGGLTVSDNTLFRRMKDAGMLASIDEARSRNYIRKTIDGARQEVLHLKLRTLEGVSM